MIRSRFSTLGAVIAAVALSSNAGAQTYAFGRTELGQIVPGSFATTAQMLFASTDVAASLPIIAQTASSNESAALITESIPADKWGVISLHASNDDAADTDEAKSSEPGFFNSTMGRVSLVGIAGLAGASYFALRSNGANNENAGFTPISPATGPNAGPALAEVVVTPEPASMALMAIGLGALGVVARRRRTR